MVDNGQLEMKFVETLRATSVLFDIVLYCLKLFDVVWLCFKISRMLGHKILCPYNQMMVCCVFVCVLCVFV